MANGHVPCGIEIPQVFIDGPVDAEHIRKFAARAEELDYDSLWTQERILSDFPMLEPVTLMTYVAAVTSRLKIGASVLLTVIRNPLQLAKSLASLDQLSGGRIITGIGLGGVRGRMWPESETVYGYASEHRATRFVEGIRIMKALWREERVTFEGRFWNFTDVAMEPKPAQQPFPPVVRRPRRAGAPARGPLWRRLHGGGLLPHRTLRQGARADHAFPRRGRPRP